MIVIDVLGNKKRLTGEKSERDNRLGRNCTMVSWPTREATSQFFDHAQ